ncbi:hypothetical protein IK146_02815 [Candidatus Saccharibacteria bacterium]|nr:hypothetical protein [Candidatus Saccharibacteria bacterium]
MSSYNYGGPPTKPGADDKFKSARRFDLSATVDEKDSSVTVKMIQVTDTHFFVFTKEAITGFYQQHPIRDRFTLCNRFGEFKRCQADLCCNVALPEYLIDRNGRTETITAVRRECKNITKDDGTTYQEVEWQFDATSDDGDVISFAWGNEVRYCAFIEALTAALFNGSKCGVYEWLYKSCCFGAAS